jgi:hypothetical protein
MNETTDHNRLSAGNGDEDWNIRKYIDFLRADEGDSVTLLCDNPEPRDSSENNAIECNGYWTNWHDRRFVGATLEAALELAYFECRQWRENPPPEVSPDPLPPARNALAAELMAFHDACTMDSQGGDGQFRIVCSSGSSEQAMALRAVLREAALILNEPQGVQEAMEKARSFIELELAYRGPDVSGHGLDALNALDRALAVSRPHSESGK